MLRSVSLPPEIRGALFLSSMPGEYESLEQAFQEMRGQGITRIVRLTPIEEIRVKSPEYYQALEEGGVPWPVEECGMPDGGIPEDRSAFLKTVRDAADRLRAGERVLVHCSAGVGRTGMFAICTLVALGISEKDATRTMSEAGAHLEKPVQREFVDEINATLQNS
jgi:protein-tyrosine phosphatase